MAPTKYPLASLHLKFQTTTLLLPITTSTTLTQLRSLLLEALTSSRPKNEDSLSFEPTILPTSEKDIAFWRRLSGGTVNEDGEEEEDIWELLKDEKSGAGTWGVKQAEEIGVSFRDSKGSFPVPQVVRPVDGDDEME